MSLQRHAVYWAPEPEHPLWAAGCAWLGRDPAQAAQGAPLPDRREPWRYGFHATLKPPMALADGLGPADLVAALQRLATDYPAFDLPPLRVGTLHDFVALRLAGPCPPLQALADDCVMRLDALRRPLTADEAARREAGLDDAQRERLARWGYPHVLAGWRCHLTLSDRLPSDERRAEVLRAAERHFAAALAAPCRVATLAWFEEPAPGQPFVLRRRFALG